MTTTKPSSRRSTKWLPLVALALVDSSNAAGGSPLRRKRNILEVDEFIPSTVYDKNDDVDLTLGTGSQNNGNLAKHSSTAHTGDESADVVNERFLLNAWQDLVLYSLEGIASMSMPSEPKPTSPTPPSGPPPGPDPTPAPVPVNPPPTPTNPTPSQTPPSEPGCQDLSREEAFQLVLLLITDGPVLANPTTPQGMALRFLLNDDALQVDPCIVATVTQRYALATFYFATGGADWKDNYDWLSSADECEWYGVTCTDGLVTKLDLCKYRRKN